MLLWLRPDDADATISVDCLRISFSQELQLVLYRHWTLYDSLCHTEYTACKFCVWTSNGRRLLREFLACMGSVRCQLLVGSTLWLCRDQRSANRIVLVGLSFVIFCLNCFFALSFHRILKLGVNYVCTSFASGCRGKNLSWFSVLNIFKQADASKWRF